MLSRISVNALLKSVIAMLCAAVVVVLALSAWNSWARLESVNQIAGVTEASGHLFKALHNLRIDRASTFRELSSDKTFTAMPALLQTSRQAEMPALQAGLAAMEATDFPD